MLDNDRAVDVSMLIDSDETRATASLQHLRCVVADKTNCALQRRYLSIVN
jgi:hypothetical protein